MRTPSADAVKESSHLCYWIALSMPNMVIEAAPKKIIESLRSFSLKANTTTLLDIIHPQDRLPVKEITELPLSLYGFAGKQISCRIMNLSQKLNHESNVLSNCWVKDGVPANPITPIPDELDVMYLNVTISFITINPLLILSFIHVNQDRYHPCKTEEPSLLIEMRELLANKKYFHEPGVAKNSRLLHIVDSASMNVLFGYPTSKFSDLTGYKTSSNIQRSYLEEMGALKKFIPEAELHTINQKLFATDNFETCCRSLNKFTHHLMYKDEERVNEVQSLVIQYENVFLFCSQETGFNVNVFSTLEQGRAASYLPIKEKPGPLNNNTHSSFITPTSPNYPADYLKRKSQNLSNEPEFQKECYSPGCYPTNSNSNCTTIQPSSNQNYQYGEEGSSAKRDTIQKRRMHSKIDGKLVDGMQDVIMATTSSTNDSSPNTHVEPSDYQYKRVADISHSSSNPRLSKLDGSSYTSLFKNVEKEGYPKIYSPDHNYPNLGSNAQSQVNSSLRLQHDDLRPGQSNRPIYQVNLNSPNYHQGSQVYQASSLIPNREYQYVSQQQQPGPARQGVDKFKNNLFIPKAGLQVQDPSRLSTSAPPYNTSGGIPYFNTSSSGMSSDPMTIRLSKSFHLDHTNRVNNVTAAHQRKHSKPSSAPPIGLRRCSKCNRTDTPEWRYGPEGAKALCNACGLKYARNLARKKRTGSMSPSPSVTPNTSLTASPRNMIRPTLQSQPANPQQPQNGDQMIGERD